MSVVTYKIVVSCSLWGAGVADDDGLWCQASHEAPLSILGQQQNHLDWVKQESILNLFLLLVFSFSYFCVSIQLYIWAWLPASSFIK